MPSLRSLASWLLRCSAPGRVILPESMMGGARGKMLDHWKRWARALKREVYALYLAYQDPRVPRYARLFAGCVVAYASVPSI